MLEMYLQLEPLELAVPRSEGALQVANPCLQCNDALLIQVAQLAFFLLLGHDGGEWGCEERR